MNYPYGVNDIVINEHMERAWEHETCGTCSRKYDVLKEYLNEAALKKGVSFCPYQSVYVEDCEEACEGWMR